MESRRKDTAHMCGPNSGISITVDVRRCERAYHLQEAKDTLPPRQGASRYAATWGTTSSDKGEGLGVV